MYMCGNYDFARGMTMEKFPVSAEVGTRVTGSPSTTRAKDDPVPSTPRAEDDPPSGPAPLRECAKAVPNAAEARRNPLRVPWGC